MWTVLTQQKYRATHTKCMNHIGGWNKQSNIILNSRLLWLYDTCSTAARRNPSGRFSAAPCDLHMLSHVKTCFRIPKKEALHRAHEFVHKTYHQLFPCFLSPPLRSLARVVTGSPHRWGVGRCWPMLRLVQWPLGRILAERARSCGAGGWASNRKGWLAETRW